MTTEAQVEPERESDVRIPMAGLFGFLPKPASAAMDPDLNNEVDAPTPDHYQLTSEGLPSGWAMQLMRNGRTLFIDNSNQVGNWHSHWEVQSNPLNGSPDNGSIRSLFQVLVSLILVLS